MHLEKIMARPGFFIGFVCILYALAWHVSVCSGQDRHAVSGITEAVKDVTLSASVQGTISAVYFKEGEHVSKGQCILNMEKKLEELEAQRSKLIWESKAEVDSAAEKVATLGSLLESTRELFDSTGSVSKEELDEKELEFKLAEAELRQLEIAEQREKIEYEMARERLRKRSLYAPFDGVIIKLFLDEGEFCEQAQPLVHLVDTSKCLLVCNEEEPIGRILKKGQSVDLSIQAGSEQIYKKGTVVFVSSIVDAASGLLEIKAEFENNDGAVRPGVAGSILLELPTGSSRPEASLDEVFTKELNEQIATFGITSMPEDKDATEGKDVE